MGKVPAALRGALGFMCFRCCLWHESRPCSLRNDWFELLSQIDKYPFVLVTESACTCVREAKMSDDIRKRFEFPNSLIESQVISFVYFFTY